MSTNDHNTAQTSTHCLIIDDDQDDQEIFQMCLKKVNENIKVLAIDDPIEAVAMLRSDNTYTPNYIFLDVNMPKMNGIDCLRLLKNMERLNYTRIYMYSTTSDGDAVAKSKQLGAEDFIVKPTKTADLKEKLAKILDVVSNIDPVKTN